MHHECFGDRLGGAVPVEGRAGAFGQRDGELGEIVGGVDRSTGSGQHGADVIHVGHGLVAHPHRHNAGEEAS
jgi:hypothetical protein